MQQQRRHSRFILGVLFLGLLAGGALTASPAQAVDAVGPYYAEPSWDQQIAPVDRFVVLMNWNSKAVLDKETGLVWEKSPQTMTTNWNTARAACITKNVGNRKGWRLPSLHELQSLIQPSGFTAGGLTLPPGHPFLNVQSAGYWSASTNAAFPPNAWFVVFLNGNVDVSDKAGTLHVWCVRGGMNADQY